MLIKKWVALYKIVFEIIYFYGSQRFNPRGNWKKKKEVFVEDGKDCLDKILNHKNRKWEGDR